MDDVIKNKISTWLGCKVGKSENLDEDIKQRIVEEAFKLFSQFGIKNVTMDEIARQMGASKKTIYQYFESKEELVYYTHLCRVRTYYRVLYVAQYHKALCPVQLHQR